MYLLSGSSYDATIQVALSGATSINYTLTDQSGSTLTTGTAAVSSGVASVTIAGTYNTLTSGPSWERRVLSWVANFGGRSEHNRLVYRVEKGVDHDATPEMVRNLLGLNATELADTDVDLTAAYFDFRTMVDAAAMDAAMVSTGSQSNIISRAIAALAALAILPALQIKLASQESSGTDEFRRWDVDWDLLKDSLTAVVGQGTNLLSTTKAIDAVGFILGTRTDVITNS